MELTTLERLILLSLTSSPNQTADDLQTATGVRSGKHFRRILRTLTMARLIVLDPAFLTYTVVAK